MSTHVPVGKIANLFPDKKIFEIHPFRVYHSGWECDEWGYRVTFLSGQYVDSFESVVLTDHGTAYIATKEQLEAYVSTLENALADALHALDNAFWSQEENWLTDKEE
jgi:hypothetical protein